MSAEELDTAAIRAREQAATEGPWTHQPYGEQNQNGDYCGGDIYDAHGEYVVSEISDSDGDFIAHARTDIPALLDEVERLRKVIEDAPHSEWCQFQLFHFRKDCDCWKASAVGTNNEEGN
jgi:hypothetical protein